MNEKYLKKKPRDVLFIYFFLYKQRVTLIFDPKE